MTVTIEFDGVAAEMRLRNLSENGALIEGQTIPCRGTALVFRKGEFASAGQIAWAGEQRCGIVFDKKLSPEILLHYSAPPKHRAPKIIQTRPGRHGLISRPLSFGDRAHAERLGVKL